MPSVANHARRGRNKGAARLLAIALLLGAPATPAAAAPTSLLPETAAPAPAEAPPPAAPRPLLPDVPATAPAPAAAPPLMPPAEPPLILAPPRPVPVVAGRDAEPGGPTESPEDAGLLTGATGGYGPALFAGSDGRFVATLAQRIDAPLASRWAQIMVQRALLSRVPPPAGIHPGDWVAARGLALVRMGSAADAHRMIERLALDRYTQPLYAAAGEAALAAGDPMALCPLSSTALALTGLPLWALADGICAAMNGDDYGAAMQFDALRRNRQVAAFDLGLAESLAATAGGARQKVTPDWQQAGGLTAWRIGLAAGGGLDLPDERLAAATAAQRAWVVRLAGQPLRRRAAFAPEAAAHGVLGSAEIDRVMAAETMALDPAAAAASPGGLLRRASAADSVSDRLEALADLWKRGDRDSAERYGWLVATAAAVARLPIGPDTVRQAGAIAEALVSAGMADAAARWWRATADSDMESRARVWAAVVAVADEVPPDADLFKQWARSAPAHRAQLLAAGLAGLGRGAVSDPLPTIENDWTRALARAAAARRTGEVMLLAAAGLHGGWASVHPDYLRRIAAALVAVGHRREARLIVAEAAVRG